MALVIIVVLLGLPFLEIAVFIEVGGFIGIGPTLLLTVLTAAAGVLMMRHQGFSAMLKVRNAIDRAELPVQAVFDGACLLVTGVLLLVPGFVTDFAGLLLFVPLFRRLLLQRLFRITQVTIVVNESQNQRRNTGASEPYDMDGEYRDVTPKDEPSLPHRYTSGKT